MKGRRLLSGYFWMGKPTRSRILGGFRAPWMLLAVTVLITALTGSMAHAQGCGGMGSHGTGHEMSQPSMDVSQSLVPIWRNMRHSNAEMHYAVSMMSPTDAEYYAELLRDDFHSLTGLVKKMYPGIEEPMASADGRVRQLTRQIERGVDKHDSTATMAALTHLDAEFDRAAALIPSAALPPDEIADSTTTSSPTAHRGQVAQSHSAGIPMAVYVCPMHADVRSNSPGKCPKCGMELQKS